MVLASARHAVVLASARHAAPLLCAAGGGGEDVGAVALIAGTAIGGGFLALPATTAAAGCLPSTAILLGSSAALLGSAFIVADLVIDASVQDGRPVSLSTCARRTLGGAGGVAIEALFLLLMSSTLVSQFAKGGALLGGWTGLPYGASCALAATAGSLFSCTASRRAVGQTNSLLALGFAAALVAVFAYGAPLADWSALAPADWSAACTSAPTLLQLLVYNEIIPTVCEVLRFDRGRVRRVLACGSLLLLLVLGAWSALGLGLAGSIAAGAGGASLVGAAGAAVTDPLAGLLASRGALGGCASALAACAVSTTVLGASLALRTLFADAAASSETAAKANAKAAAKGTTEGAAQGATAGLRAVAPLLLRRAALPLALLAATLVASTSPDFFFGAIDFAGAYPVALLWGVAPPAMYLRAASQRGDRLPRWRVALLLGFGAASLLFVGANAAADLARLLAPGGGSWRWQSG